MSAHEGRAAPPGSGLLLGSVVTVATMAAAVLTRDLLWALLALLCLSVVTCVGVWTAVAPPGSPTARQVVAAVAGLGLAAVFVATSGSAASLVVPSAAVVLAASLRRSRFFVVSAVLVCAATSAAALTS